MFKNLLNVVDWTAQTMIVVSAATMTLVVCAQVVLRYIFESSLDWAEEAARLSFVWLIFLAVPLAVKRGLHVRIELFTDRLPTNIWKVLMRGGAIFSAVLMIFVGYYGALVLWQTWYETLMTINISVGWFTVPIVTGALHSTLHLVNQAIEGFSHRNERSSEEQE